ncbi:Accumulation of dyads protein 2 [Metarhizium acridum]|uniref:GPR/FUN34 family protein n=1 Tax=Metarhizium acridum (strain CQMa 102) TaxID=655827 RepID=E9E5N1_METAQ|nr:GPR/FUN34 family protein [Metarhizium acridum CQMa 102]EFY88744.1 GPR/FUN34 family protein [Metarhizium acridum CQMa 102]KAG8425555.1 Accumulation of dyads protein 2 [Metarhizium acridum]
MATENIHSPTTSVEKEPNGVNGVQQRHYHHHHDISQVDSGFAAASGGSLNPGLWKPYEHRKFANPAPLGLSAFALTTFVLSATNTHTRGVTEPNIVVPLALGYGGLVQLLAGMWEIACGNTFGATALSSYGGFWISYAILLTPNWGITAPTGPYEGHVSSPLGFFLTGWFIFTTILLLCTLRSTVMFFLLFFTLDLAFLFLACEQYANDMGNTTAAVALQKTGGVFGFLAAFLAWYCALAGIQDSSNSFFQVPVFHFPWSEKAREDRRKSEREQA